MNDSMDIAVVGGGVAGIAAAWLLQRKHRVTIYERNDYLGGHTHTVQVEDGPDAGTSIDTGFIVLNDRTYPLFKRFLATIGVEIRDTEMSFSYYDHNSGLYYNGSSLSGLFAQRRNLVSPRFWRMVLDILRFNKAALRDLAEGRLSGLSLSEYVDMDNYSQAFADDYLFPMAAAIWSTAPERMTEFPAEYIISFYKNHGLLSLNDRPQWHTVCGGSHTYVKKFRETFKGEVHLSSPVKGIYRTDDDVKIGFKDGSEQRHETVVVAAHADQAFKMLENPSKEESAWLGAWRYEPNEAVLHTDTRFMPPVRRAWAAWNYTRQQKMSGIASLSYNMNILQGLTTEKDYIVTLNPTEAIPEEHVVRELFYSHPNYTFESLESQSHLAALNGKRNAYYCGSYFGHGFHEDAFRSGVEVARQLGVTF
jgi:uncharacterized protein